jgi:N-acetylmuramoyl-L-alanine amidase
LPVRLGGRFETRRKSIDKKLLIGGVLLVATAVHSAPIERLILLQEGQRREILTVQRGGVELAPLTTVIQGLGITLVNDLTSGTATLSCMGREVTIYNRKSLASVGGDLRLLTAPVVYEEQRWLAPLDSLPRIIEPLLNQRVVWRPAARMLIVGNVRVPRLSVSTTMTEDAVRVVIEASEKVPFRLAQTEGKVLVTVPRDTLDVAFQQERVVGGIVDQIQFTGGEENVFVFTLGKRFKQVKAAEHEGPPRLVLDFVAAAVAVKAPTGLATPTPQVAAVAPARSARIVVLDPGHGGAEVGAQGPAGTLEKDATLALARRLRGALTNQLGMQVFMTRERDQELSLDERTSIANNYKADLFVSIHANAARNQVARGSEVYFLSYQATDDDSRHAAMTEGGAEIPAPGRGGSSDLDLVLWDMAQASHLEESSALASRVLEELATVSGSEGRGVKQAPFRVLVGAAMPAILIEVGFISNPEEEKLLLSAAYQQKVVDALARGIGRYEQDRSRRMGQGGVVRSGY